MSTPQHAVETSLVSDEHASTDSEAQSTIDEQAPLVQEFMATIVGPLACAAVIVILLSFVLA